MCYWISNLPIFSHSIFDMKSINSYVGTHAVNPFSVHLLRLAASWHFICFASLIYWPTEVEVSNIWCPFEKSLKQYFIHRLSWLLSFVFLCPLLFSSLANIFQECSYYYSGSTWSFSFQRLLGHFHPVIYFSVLFFVHISWQMIEIMFSASMKYVDITPVSTAWFSCIAFSTCKHLEQP